MKDVNIVVLMCRLTKDPELRSLPSGTSLCALRVAFSTSWKNSSTGEWEDRPNYVDVTVWGNQGEACARYLRKGSQICVHGRLQWREWQTDGGNKRQAVDISAEQVQFVGGKRDDDGGGASQSSGSAQGEFASPSGGSGAVDDDIPF